MPFCEKCGNHLPEGANFCASCGAPVPPAPQQPNNPFQPGSFTPDNSQQTPYNTDYQPPKAPSQMPDSVKAFLDTEDHTAEYDPQDIQNSTVMAVLSYLGLLVLIPLVCCPQLPLYPLSCQTGNDPADCGYCIQRSQFSADADQSPPYTVCHGNSHYLFCHSLVYQRSGFPAVAAHSGAGCSGHRQRCSGKSQRTSHHWQAELD